MPDIDVFEAAYGRLSTTRVRTGDAPKGALPAGFTPLAGSRELPRSRLLPRLALMAPRRAANRLPAE